jgi:multiple sugar transport system permease protein
VRKPQGGVAVAAQKDATATSENRPTDPRVRERQRSKRHREMRIAAGFLSINLAGFILFTVVPVGYSLYMAFFHWTLDGGQGSFAGIHNFVNALNSFGFWRVVVNVLYFVGAYVPLNLFISLLLAVLLSPRSRIVKGKPLLRVLFFLPVVTPLVASSLVWSLMYGQDGIFNSVLTTLHIGAVPWLSSTTFSMPSIIIMSLWLGFGYNMILFVAGIGNIPDALYDAAAIDGAGPVRQFFSVTLPMLSPVVFFGTMMTLITSFQVFTQAFILTSGGPGDSSTTLVLEIYQEAFKYFQMGYASAIAWLLFILILAVTGVFYVLRKRWVFEEGATN